MKIATWIDHDDDSVLLGLGDGGDHGVVRGGEGEAVAVRALGGGGVDEDNGHVRGGGGGRSCLRVGDNGDTVGGRRRSRRGHGVAGAADVALVRGLLANLLVY